MNYRIVYVQDVEFGAVSHEFRADDDNQARQKAQEEIKSLKEKHGSDILIRRLLRIDSVSEMTERTTEVSF